LLPFKPLSLSICPTTKAQGVEARLALIMISAAALMTSHNTKGATRKSKISTATVYEFWPEVKSRGGAEAAVGLADRPPLEEKRGWLAALHSVFKETVDVRCSFQGMNGFCSAANPWLLRLLPPVS
jgi:hypothetical protein